MVVVGFSVGPLHVMRIEPQTCLLGSQSPENTLWAEVHMSFFWKNDQAQFPISLENRLFRPYIHYIANFSQFLKMTDSSIHSKVPSRSLPRKCTDIPLGIKVWRETGWVKFRMSFKAMMSNIRRTHQSTWRIPKNRWSSESPFWYWPPVWVKPQVSSDGCKTLMKL